MKDFCNTFLKFIYTFQIFVIHYQLKMLVGQLETALQEHNFKTTSV